MKYLNLVAVAVVVLLLLISVQLFTIHAAVERNNKALITSNQQLQHSIDEFRNLLEPIVKKYFRR